MTLRPLAPKARSFEFGPLVYVPDRQLLLRSGSPVTLGSRALEILAMFVERPGQLIEKEEIIARVWPTTIVEEGNLKVHVAALRKALHDGIGDERYIATVVGRGYRFVAPVACHYAQLAKGHVPQLRTADVDDVCRSARSHSTSIVGRCDTVDGIVSLLPTRRLISIVGPGGIGKTTVATEAARLIGSELGIEVVFVDLTAITEGRLVATAILGSIGFTARRVNAHRALVDQLRGRKILLVLDGCEHLLTAVADTVEKIHACSDDISILTTSREPLFVHGEHVLRLPPLSYPEEYVDLDLSCVNQYSAIQLFVDRAGAARLGLGLVDQDATVIGRICRRLDGIPLAIELAASRIDAFGISELETVLENDIRALGQSHRTAPERQRTLLAMIEGSYALLSEMEKKLLRRLSVFSCKFALKDAESVAGEQGLCSGDVAGSLANLVAKSMVLVQTERNHSSYRLLRTTRAYAMQKLEESFEIDHYRRRHAEYCLKAILWHRTARDSAVFPVDPRGSQLDVGDVKDALEWAGSARGDQSLATDLAVASASTSMGRRVVEECLQVLDQALVGKQGQQMQSDSAQDLRLFAARASALSCLPWQRESAIKEWKRVLDIAGSLSDTEHLLHGLWGIGDCSNATGNYSAALACARRMRQVIEGRDDHATISAIDRLVAIAEHRTGHLTSSRARVDWLLRRRFMAVEDSAGSYYAERSLTMLKGLRAHLLWLQGLPDQALVAARGAIDDAKSLADPNELCEVLVQYALPVALDTGDGTLAHALLIDLRSASGTRFKEQKYWAHAADWLDGILALREGRADGRLLAERSLAKMERYGIGISVPYCLGVLASELLRQGRGTEASPSIDRALAWAKAHHERWCLPELLRIRAEQIRHSGGLSDERSAIDCYCQAIRIARVQRSLSFELRACISWATLPDLRHSDASMSRLKHTYTRFQEGYDTVDLRQARTLIEAFESTWSPEGEKSMLA